MEWTKENWTKEMILTEVLETMDFSPSEETEGLYSDNQGCWQDHSIEDLIYMYVDNYDNGFVTINVNEDEIEEGRKFIYEFCESAKKYFNIGTDLDYFIEEYKREEEI